jgi:hypothetical protein
MRSIGNVERGYSTPQLGRRAALEKALGWAPGSIRAVLRGDAPRLAETASPVRGSGQSPVPAVSRPVLYGLDDEAEGLTEEQIESVRAVIRAMKPPPEDA